MTSTVNKHDEEEGLEIEDANKNIQGEREGREAKILFPLSQLKELEQGEMNKEMMHTMTPEIKLNTRGMHGTDGFR